MTIEVIKIENYTNGFKIWNNLVEISDNETIFHRLDFLSYHPASRFNTMNVLFLLNNSPFAVMPSAIMENDGNKQLVSPYGGSFGGPTLPNKTNFSRCKEVVEATLIFAKENDINKIKITLSPRFHHKNPSANFEIALLCFGFKLVNREIVNYIKIPTKSDLTFSNDNNPIINNPLMKFLKPKCRQCVKKAVKTGLWVENDSNDLNSLDYIHRITKEKHGTVPTHTLEELKKIKSIIGNKMKVDIAKKDQIPIAANLYFQCNSKVLLAFGSGHLKEFEHLAPVNLLNYSAMLWCQENNIPYFDFGTSSISMIPNEDLIKFKESFGAISNFRDTYEYSFNNQS